MLIQLERVRQRASEFDILHFHVDLIHFPLFRDIAHKTVTTLHGRLDLPDLKPFYWEFQDMPVVSISNDQRRPIPFANWVGTVYHGLPADVCLFNPNPKGDYVAFLGRISPEKRPDRAIEIARRAGMKIKIAAKVDKADLQYFRECIEPLLSQPHVEFVGEIGQNAKPELRGLRELAKRRSEYQRRLRPSRVCQSTCHHRVAQLANPFDLHLHNIARP